MFGVNARVKRLRVELNRGRLAMIPHLDVAVLRQFLLARHLLVAPAPATGSPSPSPTSRFLRCEENAFLLRGVKLVGHELLQRRGGAAGRGGGGRGGAGRGAEELREERLLHDGRLEGCVNVRRGAVQSGLNGGVHRFENNASPFDPPSDPRLD